MTVGARRHVRRGAVGSVRPAPDRFCRAARRTARGRRSRTPPPPGWRRRARSSVAVGSSPSTTPGRRRPSWRCCRGGRGCAPTAATSVAAATSPLRATRTSPPTSPLDQLPEPDVVRSQAQFLQRLGIDELVDEGRQAWAAAAARAGPRGDDDAQPGRARPRRCSIRPGSAGSPCSSGSAPLPARASPTSFDSQEEVEWRKPTGVGRAGSVTVGVVVLIALVGLLAFLAGRDDPGDAVRRADERFPETSTTERAPTTTATTIPRDHHLGDDHQFGDDRQYRRRPPCRRQRRRP